MSPSAIPFSKMHGLGNDFVVMDLRKLPDLVMNEERAKRIADRRFGVGCDQLILIEPPVNAEADVFMRIYNNDGSQVDACGNATRCVAAVVMAELQSGRITIQTNAGLLHATQAENQLVSVNMGPARLEWKEIPLSEERDTLNMGIELPPLSNPVGVNMGNPHAVFFVEDPDALDLQTLGAQLEHHPLFPERANINVAGITAENTLRLRVFERGAGITSACGTGACATGVAAARRGLTGRKTTIHLDGGPLHIEWREDGHVIMTGPVATAFKGELDPSLLV
ncbi:diaminopimelate epimerase [Kiloniella sp. b19]|uniref:diaminopimelate epimerase n=1 Tax=Kiloniella sp. GXU_MW_B19 TaxID=3141326 RepID=UPI0031D0FDD7